MGGRALLPLGITVRRFTNEELAATQVEIKQLLDDVGCTGVWFPKGILDKEDHGDLDVYYSHPDINLVEALGLKRHVKNGKMIHTPWGKDQDLQIDFIKTPYHEWATTKLFYDNGDLGNMIGKVARRYNMTFTHHGLYELYEASDGNTHRICMSTDPEDICQILRLDYDKISEGFESEEDLFKFILDWDLSKPSMYSLDNIRASDRIRNKKRPQYMRLLEYLTKHGTEDKECGFPYTGMVNHHEMEMCMDEIEGNIFRTRELRAKRKIIVDKLMEEGYSGKELGQKIKEYEDTEQKT